MNNQEYEMGNKNKKRKNSSNNEEEKFSTNPIPPEGKGETVPNMAFSQATIYSRPINHNIDYLFSKQIPPSNISGGQVQRKKIMTNFQSSLSSRKSLLQSPPQQQQQLIVQNQPQPKQQFQRQPLLSTANNAFGQHSRSVPQQFLQLSELNFLQDHLSRSGRLQEYEMDNNNINKKRKKSSNNEEEEEEEEEEINKNPIPEEKGETVPIPFPWATDHRATVHSLDYIFSQKIGTISGEVQCKNCKTSSKLFYHLPERFVEIRTFILRNKRKMRGIPLHAWVNPYLPPCVLCNKENSKEPVISDKKRSINWLFLLLGKMLACCNLEQLKYFCKHTKNCQSGSKDQLLYIAYIGLCKQLDPNGPFNP